jgi:glycerophosphoryl diester phosphodiesterase
MGADYLEQDLQMTADGRLVVLHDASLERTGRGPGCHGEVADLTLAAVRRCDVGRWYGGRWADADVRIPTLAEVLDRYRGRARFHIETKRPDQAPGMEEALVEMLGRAGLLPADPGDPTVLIQSFSPESLRRVAALAPALPRVQLLTRDALDAGADAVMARVAGYAHGVGPAASLVDAAFMEAARRHGLLVHPWTVNEPEEMRRLLDLGVHGIFTDVPDVLRRIVDVAGR